jgi:ketosteroid isomerase-like protein
MPARVMLPLALVAALATACGGESQEEEVRATLDRFATATAGKDFQTICDDIFSPRLVDQFSQTIPCELALSRSSLNDAEKPTLRVLRVSVDGDKATARVRTAAENQPASEDDLGLVRENGEWRIISLTSES